MMLAKSGALTLVPGASFQVEETNSTANHHRMLPAGGFYLLMRHPMHTLECRCWGMKGRGRIFVRHSADHNEQKPSGIFPLVWSSKVICDKRARINRIYNSQTHVNNITGVCKIHFRSSWLLYNNSQGQIIINLSLF